MTINNYIVKNKKNIYIERLINFISIVLTIIILVFVIFEFNVEANSSETDAKRDMFYIKIINYTMPFIKVNSFDSDDLAESTTSSKDKIFSLLYVDFKNPITYINKEISYLKINNNSVAQNENSKENKEVFKLIPFILKDNEVKKNSPGETAKEKNPPKDETPGLQVSILDPSLKKTLNASKPEVFIYHTHTSEAYAPFSNPNSYDSFDETKNVCAVGDGLAEELQKNYGISTIHDKTINNYLYNQSYSRSREILDKYLKKYGDFKIIIDLHRDSGLDRKSMVARMNGENVAKIMFVMTKKNPHYDKNMAMVNKLMEISKKLFPGFTKEEVYYYNYGTKYFNQDLSNNACIIEVGANCNTIDEAKESSKYMARIIAEYLHGKN